MKITLKKKLIDVYKRKLFLKTQEYIELLNQVNEILENENENIRPYSNSGAENEKPGGIVVLKKNISTIIVPDLHARYGFFLNILLSHANNEDGRTNLERLLGDSLQIVCVGDGLHAEGRSFLRWQKAFKEFSNNYKKHHHMDEEMKEGLKVMEMVMLVKKTFPDNFHFLKGNHENISNERGGGNYPFRKFAYEGAMVLDYVLNFFGKSFLDAYYRFEKNLPLFAIGDNFLISHAEPKTFFQKDEILNYRDNPFVTEGFTWTDNGESEPGSVQMMLRHYLGKEELNGSFYFGGHRIISEDYNMRAGGCYIQIHNPKKQMIVQIPAQGNIDLDRDIIELKDNIGYIEKQIE